MQGMLTSLTILCAQLPANEVLAEARDYLSWNPDVEETWVRVLDDGGLQLGWALEDRRSYCVDLPLAGYIVAIPCRE